MNDMLNDILYEITNDTKRETVKKFVLKDIKNYRDKLKELDNLLNNSKKHNKSIKRKLYASTNRVLKKGAYVCNGIGDKIIEKKIKRLFRNQLSMFLYKSKLLKHGYYKPAGYPGDHDIIEHVYINAPISKKLGYYLDLYALDDGYAKAIRNRKDAMKKILKSTLCNAKTLPFRILNYGAGSCREIRELLKAAPKSTYNNLTFTLIDQDKNALNYSKSNLKVLSKKYKFHYINENIINICRNQKIFKKKLGTYDLIYSIGLADYIPDYYLEQIIRFSYNVLNKTGKLVIAHKDITTYNSIMSDWICDWNFIPRTNNEVINIFKSSLKKKKYILKYNKIKDGRIIFITVIKNREYHIDVK